VVEVCHGRGVANVSEVWPMCPRCIVTEVCRDQGVS